jgi:hypothetical protein
MPDGDEAEILTSIHSFDENELSGSSDILDFGPYMDQVIF